MSSGGVACELFVVQEIQAIDNAMKKMKFGQGVSLIFTAVFVGVKLAKHVQCNVTLLAVNVESKQGSSQKHRDIDMLDVRYILLLVIY